MDPARALRSVRRRLAGRTSGPDALTGLIERGVVTIGRRTYGRPTVHYYQGDTARVRIGAFCSIADDVEFVPGGNHHTDWVSTFPLRIIYGLPGRLHDGHPWSKGDTIVGNDVWIGRGAKVLGGVTIGDGAAIAAYSVVMNDVEPYAIVGGNPAVFLRHRFDPEVREALTRIRWWEWTDAEITDRVAELMSADIAEFVATHDPGRPSDESESGA